MGYTAKITEAREEFFLSENKPFMDIHFDILLDGKVVAERRLAYPIGTPASAIEADISAYCKMYEKDYELAAKAEANAKIKEESDKILNSLKGKEIA